MTTLTLAALTSMADLADATAAAHAAAVLVDRSNLGLLKLTGKTRIDLIHRMSTQDLRNMQPGEGRATILTTDIGRIIDRLIVCADRDAAYVLTSAGNGDAIARYLLGYVFFNDDFRLENVAPQRVIYGVFGAQAQTRLHTAGFDDVELPLHHWRQQALPGLQAPVQLHRSDPVVGDGYLVIAQRADADALAERLAGAGIASIDQPAFDYLRVLSGRPRFGRELTQEYIPLEAGLWSDVSFSKGCYIGQEIIARMESRGRLAKKLFHFRAAAPVETKATIYAGDKPVGCLTSTVDGPAGSYALGYVKLRDLDNETGPFAADGVTLTVLPA